MRLEAGIARCGGRPRKSPAASRDSLRGGCSIVLDDAARCLAGAGDHAQRAGQLAVPGGEWVEPFAAVAKAVAVIATLDDMQQPAGGRESGSLSTANSRPNTSNAMWNGFQNPVAIRSSFEPSGRQR